MTEGKKGEVPTHIFFLVIVGTIVFFAVIALMLGNSDGGSPKNGAVQTAKPSGGSRRTSSQTAAPRQGTSSSDIRQAQAFVSSLPAACSGSYSESSSTGVVTITYTCGATRGVVTIRDGVVTEVQ